MRWLVLWLLAMLWGCAPLPSGKTPRQASPQPGYVRLGDDIFELPLDSDWQAQPVPVGRRWEHRRMGSLTALVLRLRPLEERWSEWLGFCQGQSLTPFVPGYQQLKAHPLYAADSAQLENWLAANKRKELEAWLKQQQKAWATADFGELMKLRIRLKDLGHPIGADWKVLEVDGQPAVSTVLPVQGGVGYGLYVQRGDQLLALEMRNFRFDTRGESQSWFAQKLPGLHRVRPDQVADPSLLDEPRPGGLSLNQVGERERSRRQRRSDSPWVRELLPWVGALIAILVIALPAYGGATAGYERAQFEGTNVRVGAAGGAFHSTLASYFLLMGIAIVSILVLAAMYNNNNGIMSLFMAAVFISVVGGLIGAIYILIAAGMAAVGAFVGAALGPRQAGWLAVLGVFFSALVTPVYMKMSDARYESRRRRHYQVVQPWKEMAYVQRALPGCRYRDSADLRGDVPVQQS